MSTESFYLVWNPSGRNPSYEHRTFDLAKNEAERLAFENPGSTFYVLKAKSVSKRVLVETKNLRDAEEIDPEEVPF